MRYPTTGFFPTTNIMGARRIFDLDMRHWWDVRELGTNCECVTCACYIAELEAAYEENERIGGGLLVLSMTPSMQQAVQ